MTSKESRELDAWIAVNVMKWVPCCGDWWPGAVNPGTFNCPVKDATEWAYEYPRGVLGADGKTYCATQAYNWQPTTEPDTAMEVLKKCAEKRNEAYDPHCPEVTLCISAPHPDWDNKWIVASDAEHTVSARAETLELAICLFARKLFGGGQ